MRLEGAAEDRRQLLEEVERSLFPGFAFTGIRRLEMQVNERRSGAERKKNTRRLLSLDHFAFVLPHRGKEVSAR